MHIFEYKGPIVSIKESSAWIINGHFKLIHVVNLQQYQDAARDIRTSAKKLPASSNQLQLINYRVQQIEEWIESLRGKHRRTSRSIDWLGSAWKWIAGSPDASDWNIILNSEESIVENNNHQYKINRELFDVTQDIITRFNKLTADTGNNISKDILEQNLWNQATILKEQVGEVVTACQMAKAGIINSNAIDKEEINRILSELETLPYTNEIEAIEYGCPSIYSNGSTLLYVVSIPKVAKKEFNLLWARASIREGKQVDMPYGKLLLSQEETFGLIAECFSISNSTICDSDSLDKLKEDDCIPRLLKGGQANCTYRVQNKETVELLRDGTVFITNFKGTVNGSGTIKSLDGTYVVQFKDETIQVGNTTFTSGSSSKLQVLPSVLANITEQGLRIDLSYIHDISLRNIRKLKDLTFKVNASFFPNASMLFAVSVIAYILWRKVNGNLHIPPLQQQPTLAETGQ